MHYSNSTRATFEALKNRNLEKFLFKICLAIILDSRGFNMFYSYNEEKRQKLFDDKINILLNIEKVKPFDEILKGEEFVFLQKKYKLDYVSNLKSFYFIENDKKLIRISDHWSSIRGQNKIKECGYIRSCFWILSNKNSIKNKYYIAQEPNSYKDTISFLSGFCMLNNFKHC